MPAVPGALRHIIPVPARTTSLVPHGISRTAAASCIPSEEKLRMHGGCMTCTEICGSGAATGLESIRPTARLIRKGLLQVPDVFFAVGAGIPIPTIAGRHTITVIHQTAGTSALDSELSVIRKRLLDIGSTTEPRENAR